jgi:uncharacterized membrane protein
VKIFKPFDFRAGLICVLAAFSAFAGAAVPSYRLQVVADYEVTTFLRGASDSGILVGTQVIDGLQRAFVARDGQGVSLLPLPSGYTSAEAYDVNASGVVVGTTAASGSAADFGDPVVWIPGAGGTYTPIIPAQFDTLPGPLGEMTIDGGQIVAINDAGTLVGWSRYQGFQGGPATRFSVSGAPTDLKALGMQATPQDINDNGIVVGGQLKFDLSDESVSDIGVPPDLPGGTGFTDSIIFTLNDSGESIVAANLASVPT